jgi:hypothetical protein
MDRFSITQAIQPKTNDGQSPACLQSEARWAHAALDRFVPNQARCAHRILKSAGGT